MIPDNVKKQRGLAGWLLQRVSGIFLTYAVAVHLWAVHVVDANGLSWQTVTARLQNGVFWTTYYLLFVPVVVYHAFNGIWGIVLDYNPSPGLRKTWAWALWVGGLALLVYGYFGLKPLLG